ncbi:Cna B-type domain-containing protein [Youngiibacter multivorans]|uniref:LPXTG-motif cell wall-anchored protein n=1 Tax=Youngiibacter multivorans TaxID=937251 RepID=A0ABS4G8D0_9CLOT|nr:LPXTG-motif cell wall-anchored protein [Youngiibacter multivorans]
MNRGLKKLLSLFVSFMMLFSLFTTKSALANTGYTLEGWHKANSLWTTGAIKGYTELDWVDLKFGVNSYDGDPLEFTVELDYNNGGIIGYEHAGYFVLYEGLGDFTPGSEPAQIVGGYHITAPVVVGDILTFTLVIDDPAKFILIEDFTLKFKAQLSDNAAEWPGASLQYRLLGADKTVSMMRNDIIYLGDLTINKVLLDANGAVLNEARSFDIVITSNNGTPTMYRTITSGSSIVIENLQPGTYTVTEPGYGTLYETTITNGGVVVFTGEFPDASLTITNKIKVSVIDVTANKIWVGGPTPRPTVQFQLYRRISGGADMAVGDVKNLPDGTLQVTWPGLPSTDPQGNLYIYTVKEIGTPTNYSKSEVGLTVTNTYVPPKENITANKIWVGGPTPRPTIAFQLYRSVLGGAAVAVGDPKNLVNGVIEVTWNDMPTTDMNGNPYTYTVQEVGTPTNYTKSENGLTVTNTYVPPRDNITATKIWVGGPSPRPTITFQLYRSVLGGAAAPIGDPKDLVNGVLQVTWNDMPLADGNGNPYTYTVREVGTPTNYTKNESGLTVTNTYVPPKTDISANKIWVGGPTPRPTVTFQLYRSVLGGAAVPVGDPKDLVNGVLQVTWMQMPTTDTDGNPYTYTVQEVGTPANYSKSENGLTVTNTYIPPKRDITATKVWVGGPSPRPTITFQLYRSVLGGAAVPVEAPKDLINGTLQVTWNQLPLTDGDGNEYTYSVREVGTPTNYTKDESGLTVTNTYVPPKADITATKIWVGGAAPRPTVTFQLYRSVLGGAAIPVESPKDLENGVLQVTWMQLPTTDNDGNPYTYTVMEVGTPLNYTKDESGLTVTNTYHSPLIDVTGTKIWVGGPSPRPDIELQLYRRILGGADAPVGSPVTIKDGTLSYKWEDVEEFNSDGIAYIYTIKEVGTPLNYTKLENGLTVTNTYHSPLIDVTGTKIWVGGPSPRPDIQLQLFRKIMAGPEMPVGDPVTLKDGTTTYKWEDVEEFNNDGVPYIYYVKEIGTPMNYTKAEEGMTVTNRYNSPLIDVTGTKTWVGGPSPRPDIQLQLFRQIGIGPKIAVGDPVTLVNGTITYKWEDVPQYNNDGVPYIYSVDEVAVPENYSKALDGMEVTNTYHSPLIDVTGTKIWVGGPSPRPDIELQLYRRIQGGADAAVGSPVTIEDGTTTYKWEDVAEFNNDGIAYIYSIKEVGAPANYTKTEDGMTVTNTYHSPLIDVIGTKIWDGGPSPRPEIQLQLFRQIGEGPKVPVRTPATLPSGTTTYKWIGVDEFNNDGVPYIYTVDEVAVPLNYVKTLNGLTVTNTYESPLTDVLGTKIWVGGPSPRPDVQLQLSRHIEGGEMEEVGEPVTLVNGTTTYLWEDLPETDGDGEPYIYTVDEVMVPENYEKELDGLEVTNTYVPPVTDITGTKIWMGGPSPRPTIELQLWRVIPEGEPEMVGDPVELPDGTSEYMWEDMPTTDFDGHPYTYSVEEVVTGENYEKIEEGMEVTNEYVSPKTYVTVEKIWVGGPETRPTIYIQLYRKIAEGDKVKVGEAVGLPSGTNEYTWNNLDVTDYDGNPYIYSVEEADVAGYVKVIQGFEISNTRIKGTIEFHKHDDAHMPLAGAVFGLYAVTDTMFAAPLKTATSLADGLVRFTDVEYGEYKIKEISAPVGYVKSEVVIPVAVTMQGQTVVTTPATVVNVKIMGDITLRKVDSVTNEVLAGAKMVIKDKAGAVVFEGTTGADGLLKVMLPYGEYIISEVAAPEGYILTTQTYSINVNKSGLTFDVRIPNTEEEELPQTGGIPSELLYLMGAMAIIGGVVLMKGKRRKIG